MDGKQVSVDTNIKGDFLKQTKEQSQLFVGLRVPWVVFQISNP